MKTIFVRFIIVVLVMCSIVVTCGGCSFSINTRDTGSKEESIKSEENTVPNEPTQKKGSETYQAYMELLKQFDRWMDLYIRTIENYENNPMYYLGEYYKMLYELAEWEEKFANIDEEDMTNSEAMKILAEYSRILYRYANRYAN